LTKADAEARLSAEAREVLERERLRREDEASKLRARVEELEKTAVAWAQREGELAAKERAVAAREKNLQSGGTATEAVLIDKVSF
jgi:uncharacterized protein (DUF3084 family)